MYTKKSKHPIMHYLLMTLSALILAFILWPRSPADRGIRAIGADRAPRSSAFTLGQALWLSLIAVALAVTFMVWACRT